MDEFNIPQNLYGFSLSSYTSRILWRLKPLDMCYSLWPNNIDHYLYILTHDQPKYIVGMGTYSGIDQGLFKQALNLYVFELNFCLIYLLISSIPSPVFVEIKTGLCSENFADICS